MQIYNKWLRGRVLNELCKRISDTKHLDCAYLRYTRLRGCVFSVFCKRISDTKHLDCAYLRYTRLRGCVFSVLCKRISVTKGLAYNAYLRYTQVIWKHQAMSLQLLFLKSKIDKIISFFR